MQFHKLQDRDNQKVIILDEALRRVFTAHERCDFAALPQMLGTQLAPLEPLTIDYEISVDKAVHVAEQAYDIEVEVDNVARHAGLTAFLTGLEAHQRELSELDDRISQAIGLLKQCDLKREFLAGVANNPVEFLDLWLVSQARDLKTILGEKNIHSEERRRALFFRQPWIQEAVFHYLSVKTQQRVQEMMFRPSMQPQNPAMMTPGGMSRPMSK